MISSVAKLHDILEACGRVAIAFSGGCDSAVLAEAARRTLGADNVLLLIAVSVLLPRSELRRAESCAAGLRLEKIEFDPLSHPEVAANTPQRCYFCKKNLFNTLLVCSTDHLIIYICEILDKCYPISAVFQISS